MVTASAIGSLLIGLAGIFPLLFVNKNYAESKFMKYVLGFGAGTLLGDAFLHLLPEVIGHYNDWPYGVLAGYMFGFIAQKMLPEEDAATSGAYINLFANCLDNFTHGLAVAGAFVISMPMGVKTTLTILMHEVPHELGDFAILMRGGLSKSRAAFLQVLTATAGLAGAMFVIFLKDVSPNLVIRFIIPFTVGAFIYVALTNVLPELKEDQEDFHWVVLSLIIGIALMGFLSM